MATVASKFLFCEGRPGGTDAVVVRAAIASPSVRVRPVGRKGAFVYFVQDPMLAADCSYMGIRDRDFDIVPEAQRTGLLHAHRTLPIYAWGRLEIENYFLDGHILKAAYDGLRGTGHRGLTDRSEGELCEALDEAASQIVSYEAARWTLSQLRPSGGWPVRLRDWCEEFRLPADCSRDACWEALAQQVGTFSTSASEVSAERAEELFAEFHDRFQALDFISGGEHLVWFSGKDMLASLEARLTLQLGTSKVLARHARDALVRVGPANAHADFAELAALASRL